MCINPIKIKNVNKGLGHFGLNFMKDCDNDFMYVPCGRCPECVAVKQSGMVQRIQCEAKYNHLFFCTLTYDNAHLPKLTVEVPAVRRGNKQEPGSLIPFDFDSFEGPLFPDKDSSVFKSNLEVQETSSGCKLVNVTPAGFADEDLDVDYEEVTFPYADIHHVQLLLKNLRDNNATGRNIRYVAVSELGKANGRPHFHILFMLEKRPGDFLADGRVDVGIMRTLEKQLYTMVFKYWGINVGTRKNPVYEKLFTYRKRFYGSRVYTNFDLHWVDPSLSQEGESNVAFYVTKYIMKGSTRDEKRQQFLRLNLSESEYESAWSVIKCRMTCSKGLGLDARLEFVDKYEPIRVPLYVQAQRVIDSLVECDDLPADYQGISSLPPVYRAVRRRILVPNFELADWIRSNVLRDVGKAPGPVFIDPSGVHRPLAHYFQRFGFVFSTSDAIEYWMNWNPALDKPHSDWDKEKKDRCVSDHEKRLRAIDCNSTFDTSPEFLGGSMSEGNMFNPISF